MGQAFSIFSGRSALLGSSFALLAKAVIDDNNFQQPGSGLFRFKGWELGAE